MKKSEWWKKVFAMVLCSVVAGGTMLTLPAVNLSVGMTASAAENLVEGEYEYSLNSNDTVVIQKYHGNGGTVSVPETIDGKNVVSIGWNAFKDCTGLTSIILPDTVTFINSSAFRGCTGLQELKLSKNLRNIGISAFSGCTGLTQIQFPEHVETIGEGSFIKCTGLTTLAIPNSVTTIDNTAFAFCTGLKSIMIPDSVTKIGDSVFVGCSNLKMIYGVKGSYAEEYANKNNIAFSELSLKNRSAISTTASVGEPITLNAVAEGGTGGYTYALMYKKSTNTTWTKIGVKYGTQSTGSFTPKSAVSYDIMMNVKDSSGKIKSKTFTVDVKAPLKNKTTVNAGTVKVGEKIVLKGAASGGSKGYKYAFYYKKSKNSTWTEMKPAYTTKSAAFKPGSAVCYDVKSVVMDADGRTTEKVYTINVTK